MIRVIIENNKGQEVSRDFRHPENSLSHADHWVKSVEDWHTSKGQEVTQVRYLALDPDGKTHLDR